MMHIIDSLMEVRIMANNNSRIINAETLRDFCGTLISKLKPGDVSSKTVYDKATKAFEYTGFLLMKRADRKQVDKVYINHAVANVMKGIFETDLFPETKSLMENVLHKGHVPTSDELKRFIIDYYGAIYLTAINE